ITLSRASSILSSVNLASSNSTSATLSDLTPGTYLIAASYSGDSHFTAATATMQQVVVIPPFGPPPKLNAISTGGPVAVSWIGTRDVDHYEVWRNNGAGWNPISTAPQAEYSDSTVGANLAYLYRVRGFTAGGLPSDFSPVDAAITFVFMDNAIIPGVTPIRLAHLTELRSAVNSLRNVYFLGSFGWAESSPTMVSASQWIELRDAVNATRNAIGQAPLAYTDPALSSGATIRAVHVEELRAGIR
ncbi:MAG: hypothetical protein ACXW3E_14240, partial [Thermoanaerobaculia bacterium]